MTRDQRLEEIREYLSKMTPGPWDAHMEDVSDKGYYTEPQIFSIADESAPKIVCTIAVGRNEEHDGPGIAKLRTDAEWLLSLIQPSSQPECFNCGHSSVHGKYGCEYERGDRWIDVGNGDRLVAQGPCGCKEFAVEEQPDDPTNQTGGK